jgi:DNA-binding CsgD family transcriptional regulator
MPGEMGMLAFAERALRELQATGETVRKRQDDTRSDLTPQGEQIARLALEGRSNLEISAQLSISARTVEWHLGKVFTKLGIGSRRELRDALPARVRTRGESRDPWPLRLRRFSVDGPRSGIGWNQKILAESMIACRPSPAPVFT